MAYRKVCLERRAVDTKKCDIYVAETVEVEENWIYILDLDGKEKWSTDEML